MPNTKLIVSHGTTIAIDRLRDELKRAEEAVLTSAYVTPSAIDSLLPSLKALLDRRGILSLYATFDGTVSTRPDAFRELLRLVPKYPGQVSLYLFPSGRSLFHAKAFLFRGSNGQWGGIVGSANLTRRALEGGNFEVCTDTTVFSDDDIQGFRNELDKLRVGGRLLEVTEENLDRILRQFGIDEDELDDGTENGRGEPGQKERARQRRVEQGKRITKRLEVAVPRRLNPLPPIEQSPRSFVEELCGGGVAIEHRRDVKKLSFSLNLDSFVRAEILAKEKSERMGHASENVKKGYSYDLIPENLRKSLSTVAQNTGRIISMRSVDVGYARWVPRPYLPNLLDEIRGQGAVREVSEKLDNHKRKLHAEISKLHSEFPAVMKKIVKRLKPREKKYWKSERLRALGLTKRSTKEEVRKCILAHLVNRYAPRVSEPFVRSLLSRISFEPRTFEFPLDQAYGGDPEYGHKWFLASLVWAWTDPMLEGATSRKRGSLAAYLTVRREANRGRNKEDSEEAWDARAGRWLDPSVALSDAVREFREFYGPDRWTWDAADLSIEFLEPSQDHRALKVLKYDSEAYSRALEWCNGDNDDLECWIVRAHSSSSISDFWLSYLEDDEPKPEYVYEFYGALRVLRDEGLVDYDD